jgi:hypothetical protein
MSGVQTSSAIETPTARTLDMKLEIVVIPVSDVDRAKRFFRRSAMVRKLGAWRDQTPEFGWNQRRDR